MELSLQLQNTELLEGNERADIDRQIDRVIAEHKNNRYEINRLVFESVAALTESENDTQTLRSQGIMKRFFGGLTGKNQELRNNIAGNLARSQYASQQTLQKLAEQNLMSFELITAVNNKLNTSLIEVETEINKIYGTLVTFFKQTKSDIIQLENRVERLERNVNLLNWLNSIEYQMYQGVEYGDLAVTDKIVCLIRDFYDITKGEWTTSDLLLLKSAMSSVGLSPREIIHYRAFIQEVCSRPDLYEHLFGTKEMLGIEREPEYVALAAGIEKVRQLEQGERYLVSSAKALFEKYGCVCEIEDIKYGIMEEYEREQAYLDINGGVNLYDFILEILYNLEQLKETQKTKYLPDKMVRAETLFYINSIDAAFPMLKELARYGYTRARYMLALIYEDGWNGVGKNVAESKRLLEENAAVNDVTSIVRLGIPLNEGSRYEWFDKIKENMSELKELAEGGDPLAAEEYARCCINFEFLDFGKNDYEKAIEMFKIAPIYLGDYGIARRYDMGQGVEKDYEKSFYYYRESADMGYLKSQYEVGRCYTNGWGVEKNLKQAEFYYQLASDQGHEWATRNIGYNAGQEKDYTKAKEYYQKAADMGLACAYNDLGLLYEYGNGVSQDNKQAYKYYEQAAIMGHDYGQCNLGFMYLNGTGVDVDRNKAREWFEKSAAQGHQRAKDALEKNFPT